MVMDRSEIKFAPEESIEDRTIFGEGHVTWMDLVWYDFRLEKGHSMDDDEWALMVKGRFYIFVRSIRKAKDHVLELMGGK